jgi:predicted metal-dependent phosphoesterase TrpH
VQLHCHTADDPYDYIPYSARDLIDRAAELGYSAIAITLHDADFDPATEERYARSRGITFIAGIERTIAGKHVLLLNFPASCARVNTFADLLALKSAHPRGLVVAPHPFYPNPSALKSPLVGRTPISSTRSK